MEVGGFVSVSVCEVFSSEALWLLLASPHVTALANETLLQLTARAEVLSLSYGCVHSLGRISNQLL